MKKFFKLLFVFLVVFVSSVMTSCDGINTNIFVSGYDNLSSLAFVNDISVDGGLTVKKNGYFSYNDGNLKGYSLVNRYTGKLLNNNSQSQEYVSNSLIYLLSGEDGYLKEFDNSGIMSYLGFTSILDDINGKSIVGNKIEGSISADRVAGLVRSIVFDCGYFEDNYNNYFFNSTISYCLYVNESKDLFSSIELDITSVLKLKDYSISNATSTFVFLDVDVDDILSVNSFPTINDDSNKNDSLEQSIKLQGIDFINDCYEDVKYVSDDLCLYTNTILSSKLSFAYESSDINVLSNDGKYMGVSSDERVTLTVHLKYGGVEYTSLNFSFYVIPKPVDGNGNLGSITNPLYKGRKEIDEIRINFIEMHQEYGDAVYIQAGDFDMLIDAGASVDGGYVNDFLRRNVSDGRIEMLVATHPHSDHIGGMLTALSTFDNVTYAVDYGYTMSDSSLVKNVRTRFEKADNYHPITDCIDNLNGARDTIYITNDFYISFLDTGCYLDPSEDHPESGFDANKTSIALMITFKNQKYYFAGDLTSVGEKYLVNHNFIKTATVAKASHHGSNTSNTQNILSALNANVTVISTALVNRGSSTLDAQYQPHPNNYIFSRLQTYSKKVYCNFTMGTVEVTCDGASKVNVRGYGLTTPYYMNGVAVTGEENLEFKDTQYAKKYKNN